VSESASISSGIAARYAKAIFDLAKEAKTLPALEEDLDVLAETLESNAEFGDLISSPVYSRDDQAKAVAEIAKKMKLSALVTNLLGLMAGKRRLFVLPALIASVKEMIADEKGEISSDITAA
jgi:F-type H+-transporting ATPase subunit delta